MPKPPVGEAMLLDFLLTAPKQSLCGSSEEWVVQLVAEALSTRVELAGLLLHILESRGYVQVMRKRRITYRLLKAGRERASELECLLPSEASRPRYDQVVGILKAREVIEASKLAKAVKPEALDEAVACIFHILLTAPNHQVLLSQGTLGELLSRVTDFTPTAFHTRLTSLIGERQIGYKRVDSQGVLFLQGEGIKEAESYLEAISSEIPRPSYEEIMALTDETPKAPRKSHRNPQISWKGLPKTRDPRHDAGKYDGAGQSLREEIDRSVRERLERKGVVPRRPEPSAKNREP